MKISRSMNQPFDCGDVLVWMGQEFPYPVDSREIPNATTIVHNREQIAEFGKSCTTLIAIQDQFELLLNESQAWLISKPHRFVDFRIPLPLFEVVTFAEELPDTFELIHFDRDPHRVRLVVRKATAGSLDGTPFFEGIRLGLAEYGRDHKLMSGYTTRSLFAALADLQDEYIGALENLADLKEAFATATNASPEQQNVSRATANENASMAEEISALKATIAETKKENERLHSENKWLQERATNIMNSRVGKAARTYWRARTAVRGGK